MKGASCSQAILLAPDLIAVRLCRGVDATALLAHVTLIKDNAKLFRVFLACKSALGHFVLALCDHQNLPATPDMPSFVLQICQSLLLYSGIRLECKAATPEPAARGLAGRP